MKKSTFFKSASLALACAAAATAFSGCGSKNYAENNTAFFIGASGPLTGSAASYGIAVQRGAELAVEEINAKNEDGMRFTFEIKDDKASAADVPTNFAAPASLSRGLPPKKICLRCAPRLRRTTLRKMPTPCFRCAFPILTRAAWRRSSISTPTPFPQARS